MSKFTDDCKKKNKDLDALNTCVTASDDYDANSHSGQLWTCINDQCNSD